jgi:hypothetical protein
LVTQIEVLRDAVRRMRARAPFRIDAWGRPSRSYALLVDFGLWTLPQGDADFPGRWSAIKPAFVIPTGANADSPCPALSRARPNATYNVAWLLPLPLFGQAHQEDLISFLEGVLPKNKIQECVALAALRDEATVAELAALLSGHANCWSKKSKVSSTTLRRRLKSD